MTKGGMIHREQVIKVSYEGQTLCMSVISNRESRVTIAVTLSGVSEVGVWVQSGEGMGVEKQSCISYLRPVKTN